MTTPDDPPESKPKPDDFEDEALGESTAGPPLHFDPICVIDQTELFSYRRWVESGFGLRKDASERQELKKMAQKLLTRGPTRSVALAQDWAWRLDALESDMPAFAEPIDFVRSRCRLRAFSRTPLRIAPMLLAGHPGVGKSYFASRLATALGLPSYLHSLQTAETVSNLTGTDKHWSNSEPGYLFREIMLGRVANPVVILDEMEKARIPSSANGYAPARELLSVTEISTSRRLRDKCVDLSFDASYAIYVACVNALSPIEAPLLSRFRIFLIGKPDARTRVATARSVAREVYAELRLTGLIDPPSGAALQQLALMDTARLMRRLIEDGLVAAIEAGRRTLLVGDLQGQGPALGRQSSAHPC